MSQSQAISNHDPIDATTRTVKLAMQAARRGAADARAAAARKWPATGRFVSRLVYTTCYATAYGVVFPTVLLARSVPANNAAAQGLIDGTAAACQKVEGLCEKAPENGRPASAHRSSGRSETKPSVSTVSPPAHRAQDRETGILSLSHSATSAPRRCCSTPAAIRPMADVSRFFLQWKTSLTASGPRGFRTRLIKLHIFM